MSSVPSTFFLDGPLANGMRLKRPILLSLAMDDDEYVVSEQGYHMHGYGSTPAEAVDDFRRIVASSYEFLSNDHSTLSPQLREQLDHLASVIAFG